LFLINVCPATRHKKYPNVFGLGDASNLPTSKTAAAVSSQATVATANLLTVLRDSNATLPQSYSGYTSCPLVTGYGFFPSLISLELVVMVKFVSPACVASGCR